MKIDNKLIFICLLALILFSITCVSATQEIGAEETLEISDSDEIIAVDNDLSADNSDNPILKEISKGDFNIIQDMIDNASSGDVITLDRNYSYTKVLDLKLRDGIVVDKDNLTINGNGFAIDGRGDARIFDVKANGITFVNITFVNGHNVLDGGAIKWEKNCINGFVLNCVFMNNTALGAGAAIYWAGDNVRISGSVFRNNNVALAGSAIVFAGSNIRISNSTFLDNRGDATTINSTDDGRSVIINLTGLNNYINAIHSENEITFENVTYFNGAVVNSDDVAPVFSLAAAGINVTIEVVDNTRGIVVDKVNLTTDLYGQAFYDYASRLLCGSYSYNVTHKRDSYYGKSIGSNTGNFEVIKTVSNISAVYDDIAKELTVTLFNGVSGAPIRGASVAVSVGGENYTVKINGAGKGVVSLADFAPGTYTALISYAGGVRSYPSSTSLKIVARDNSSLSAVYDDIAKELTVCLFNGVSGAPIRGASVAVSVGGENYTVKINGAGKGVISLADLVPGTYTALISYAGGARVHPSSTSLKIVARDNSSLSAVYDDIAKELTVTLVNEVTGAPIKGATVAVSVGGKEYTVKINGAGKGVISLADFAPGTYTALISYAGGARVHPSSTSLKIVARDNSSLSAVYDDIAKELTVTLVNEVTGAPINGASVAVGVGGENYTVKINGAGKGVVSLAGLAPGNYTALISYAGGARVNPSSASLEIVAKDDNILSM